jgi:hypothetical protein
VDGQIENEKTSGEIELIEIKIKGLPDNKESRGNIEKRSLKLSKNRLEDKKSLIYEKEINKCTDRESVNEEKENNKEKERDKNNKEKDKDNNKGKDKRKVVFALNKKKATNINEIIARLLNRLLQNVIGPNMSKILLKKIQLIRILLR